MKPCDALNWLDQVGASVNTNREGHVNIQQTVMTLRVFIEQHDPLQPSGDAVNTTAIENLAKNDQKIADEKEAAEVRAKGEK